MFNAWDKLDEEFVLINGDTFFDIDYSILFDFVNKNKSDACIALRFSENIERYGFVNIDDNYKILSFIEKSELPKDRIDGYINGGIYYFKKQIIKDFYEKSKNKFISMEVDIFPQLIEENKLSGLPFGEKFIYIGIPDDYFKAQKEIPAWLAQEKNLHYS